MTFKVNLINSTISLLAFLSLVAGTALGQQQVQVIDYCANVQTYSIPEITDLDEDGMDDGLESLLIQRYAPPIRVDPYDDCPSGAPGTGAPDGLPNLVPCRLYYIPPQWVLESSAAPSLNPIPVTPEVGSRWFNERVIMSCAVLYGRDCGICLPWPLPCFSHLADIEAFYIRLQQIGHPAGARFDTNLDNWVGGWIETIAHQGSSPCEKREDGPWQITTGAPHYSELFSSADKHGNYLTLTRCNGSCDDSCSYGPYKSTTFFNAGEPARPFVTDLGQFRSDYSGENVWGDTPFLLQYGNPGAGTIKSKLLYQQTFIIGGTSTPLSCTNVCDWYYECRSCGSGTTLAYNTCMSRCYFGLSPTWNCIPQP